MFNEALGFEPENAEVRRDLAEFHDFHMVRAEGQRDATTLAFHRERVEPFNEGAPDGRLRG